MTDIPHDFLKVCPFEIPKPREYTFLEAWVLPQSLNKLSLQNQL
jgi:hypothetical protein